MDGALLELGSALSLTEEEEEGVFLLGDIPLPSNQFRLTLVGRLLSPRPANFDALTRTFLNLLRPSQGVDIRHFSDYRYYFVFHHIVDLRRTLALRPWTFDRNLLILQPLSSDKSPETVSLDWCPFYVRVHGIPYGLCTMATARSIGSKVGAWEDDSNIEDCITWQESLRIRVLLNVTVPLKRALRVRLHNDSSVVVRFTYERVPNFCYLCGRLGHIQQLCDLHFSDGFIDPGTHAPYGWLRSEWLQAMGPGCGCVWFVWFWSSYKGPTCVLLDPPSLSVPEPITTSELGKTLETVSSPPIPHTLHTSLSPPWVDVVVPMMHNGLRPESVQWPPSFPAIQTDFNLIEVPLNVAQSGDVCSLPSFRFSAGENGPTATGRRGRPRGGGLATKRKLPRHIDVIVESGSSPWRFTGFYGEPEIPRRHDSWALLRRLKTQSSLPWLVGGDFNAMLYPHEKQSLSPTQSWLLQDFRSVVVDIQLLDLGYVGAPFTWCDKREVPFTVRCRLNRGLGNGSWRVLFLDAQVEHLPLNYSDHCPLLVHTAGIVSSQPPLLPHWPFRLEAFWAKSSDCRRIVQDVWQGSDGRSN
ncbi:hypothetical protein Salat_0204900 [Sesamum alatum]|uniref:CCHC-type domain-containing protein n=1 Tax=Sesamum alatum TaxID=300844 RepID=A0AAE1YYA7_9LAMI|nr:hypothetical protein Salat_0204900 [Sesamum alatum]